MADWLLSTRHCSRLQLLLFETSGGWFAPITWTDAQRDTAWMTDKHVPSVKQALHNTMLTFLVNYNFLL